MCILFWYQNDGTNNPIKIISNPAAEAETGEERASKGAETKEQTDADQNDRNLQVEDPRSILDLDSTSEMVEENQDTLSPTEKLLNNFKLIIASNRDEFYDRATKPLHFWNDAACDIVAAKDMKAGGTWLG